MSEAVTNASHSSLTIFPQLIGFLFVSKKDSYKRSESLVSSQHVKSSVIVWLRFVTANLASKSPSTDNAIMPTVVAAPAYHVRPFSLAKRSCIRGDLLHPLIIDANAVRALKTPVPTVAKYAESETDVEISDE
jgi:hypothetical protein